MYLNFGKRSKLKFTGVAVKGIVGVFTVHCSVTDPISKSITIFVIIS